MNRRTSYLPSRALSVTLLIGWLAVPASALDYKRDIMPIFEEKCFDCHGDGKSKGGLKLDDPKGFYKRFAKNEVVIPGNWDGSYLFVAVSRPPKAKDAMPPKGKGKSLTPEEVMKVAKWIYEGARIDGERGEKGPKDDNPEDFIKFKNGVMMTDSFDHVAEEEEPAAKAKQVPRDWFNTEGKKIVATFKGIEGEKVILVRKDGKTFKYPIVKLSEKSRELLKTLKEPVEKAESEKGGKAKGK